MNILLSRKQYSDKLSICLSLCCILHCIALPILIILMPGLASFWINDESIHVVLVLFAIPISLFAMTKSLREHNDYKCIGFAILGLFLLTLAISCMILDLLSNMVMRYLVTVSLVMIKRLKFLIKLLTIFF